MHHPVSHRKAAYFHAGFVSYYAISGLQAVALSYLLARGVAACPCAGSMRKNLAKVGLCVLGAWFHVVSTSRHWKDRSR